ncbi:beta-1,3-glucan-binding protein-like [Condylostylus longicornis]|uniref:beta-1,3-glucan-binding protein-like n=1 Tax=Condylostylus longicornis TaxID=2530218 RepID=UPI00244DE90B|nr:beta-1,3-glucan-binding protein-like [Condylostylus longicornis]
MVNAPWFIRNSDIHRVLGIPLIVDEIASYATKQRARLEQHVNIEGARLLDNGIMTERFDRTRPFNLTQSTNFLMEVFCQNNNGNCENVSITTISGETVNKTGIICSGDLIFEDNFDTLDFSKWQHENTLAGGGNWEFQWYTNNRSNSFVKNGNLHIRPTLTSDIFGEEFLMSGTINILGGSPADECTNPSYWGCERNGTPLTVINPVRSARLRSVKSFSFKYGKVEVRAKLPSGDWLWPAIWLLPKHNTYGSWPCSGEIDIIESRGNLNLFKNGVNIGAEQVSSTLHFGPYPYVNAYKTTHFTKNSPQGLGFDKNFHKYQMEWTSEFIKFSIDDIETGKVNTDRGFWNRGRFGEDYNLDNPWQYGSEMAPFDHEFYLIISLAVGGITYFPDDAESTTGKPWINNSPTAMAEFWRAKNLWLPTWNIHNKNYTNSSLLIDYIRVYAI